MSANSRSTKIFSQPKITAVDATINIYPDRRSFDGTVRYHPAEQDRPADDSDPRHRSKASRSSNIQFDRPFHLVSSAPRNLYAIYALDQPLAPGEIVMLTFNVGHQSRGFRDDNELPELAYNGTFFDSDYFPYIGYNRGVELDDPRRRREEQLPALEEMAHRGDPDALAQQYFLSRFRLDHVSHRGQHLVPIRLLSLQATCSANGRTTAANFYEYSMGSTHILDFFAYISARYKVRKETYQGSSGDVSLEIYYDPLTSI